jgi:hypothetical protein
MRFNKMMTLLGIASLSSLVHASLPADAGAYGPQVIRSSETWDLEPGIADRLSAAYDNAEAAATTEGKDVPDAPVIRIRLIGYLTASIVVVHIRKETEIQARAFNRAPAALFVTGAVEGEPESRVELIFLGKTLVGSVRLQGGETYLLDSKSPGRYVVAELKASWKVSEESDGD